MFPPLCTVLPLRARVSAVIVVVVVFPSVPVIAYNLQGHKSKNTSISEVTVTPISRAFFSSGMFQYTPGARKTISLSYMGSRYLPPRESLAPAASSSETIPPAESLSLQSQTVTSIPFFRKSFMTSLFVTPIPIKAIFLSFILLKNFSAFVILMFISNSAFAYISYYIQFF